MEDKETSAENISKLVGFIEEIKENFDGAKPWTTETLSSLVYRGVEQAIKDHPEAIGWVRANKFVVAERMIAPEETIAQTLTKLNKRLNDKITLDCNVLYTHPNKIAPQFVPMTFECTWEEIFLSFVSEISVTADIDECCLLTSKMLAQKFADQVQDCPFDSRYILKRIDISKVSALAIKTEFESTKLVVPRICGSDIYWHISELGIAYLQMLHDKKYHQTIE